MHAGQSRVGRCTTSRPRTHSTQISTPPPPIAATTILDLQLCEFCRCTSRMPPPSKLLITNQHRSAAQAQATPAHHPLLGALHGGLRRDPDRAERVRRADEEAGRSMTERMKPPPDAPAAPWAEPGRRPLRLLPRPPSSPPSSTPPNRPPPRAKAVPLPAGRPLLRPLPSRDRHRAGPRRCPDRGQPQRPLQRRDHGQVGDPQSVRSVRGEVVLHQVRGEVGAWVPAGGTPTPAGADPGEAGLAHEPFDTLETTATPRGSRGVADMGVNHGPGLVSATLQTPNTRMRRTGLAVFRASSRSRPWQIVSGRISADSRAASGPGRHALRGRRVPRPRRQRPRPVHGRTDRIPGPRPGRRLRAPALRARRTRPPAGGDLRPDPARPTPSAPRRTTSLSF